MVITISKAEVNKKEGVVILDKYRIVIPRRVRAKIGMRVGDILEASVERGKITLTPTSVIDRGIDQSLEDFGAGRSYGPFNSSKELIASLHKETKNLKKAYRKK